MEQDVLRDLTESVTVRNIMTQVDQLRRADTHAEAEILHRDYDVVPCPKSGEIKGYFHRNVVEQLPIEPKMLFADSTTVLDMPRLFMESNLDFCFVVTRNGISGYVHYSDMNKTIALFPLLTLLLSAEWTLSQRLPDPIPDEDLKAVLGGKRVSKLRRERANRQEANVDLGWTGVLYMTDVLKLASHYWLFPGSPDRVKEVVDVRNRCVHSGEPLIAKDKDFGKLERVRLFCEEILSGHGPQ